MFHFLVSHGKRNSAVHIGDESIQEEKYDSIEPRSIEGTSSLSRISCDKVKLLPENDVSSDILSHDNKQIESAFSENKEKWSDGKTKFWNSCRSGSDESSDDRMTEARSFEPMKVAKGERHLVCRENVNEKMRENINELAINANKAISCQKADETTKGSKERKEEAKKTECQTTKSRSALNLEKETMQINIFPNFREYFQELFEKVRKQLAHQSKLKFLRSKEMTKTGNWKPAEEINIGVYMARKDDSVTPEKREINSQKIVGEETREQATEGKKSGGHTKGQHSNESEKKNKRVKEYRRSKKMKSKKKSKKKTRKTETGNDEATVKTNYSEDTESGLLKKKTAKGKKNDSDSEFAVKVFQGNTKNDQIPKKSTRPEQSEGLTTLTKNLKSKGNNSNKNDDEEIIDGTEKSPDCSCPTFRIKNATNKKLKCTDTGNTTEEHRGSPTYERRIITIGPKINKQKSEDVIGSTHAATTKRERETIQEGRRKASIKASKKKGKEEDQDVTTRERKTDLVDNPDSNEVAQENPGQKVNKTKNAVKFDISYTTTEHKDSLQQPTTNNPNGKKSNKISLESIKCSSDEKGCSDVYSSTQSKIGNEDNEGGNGAYIDYNQDEDKEQAEVQNRGKESKNERSVQKKKKKKLRIDAEKESKLFSGEDVKQVEEVGKPEDVTTTWNTQWEHIEALSMKKNKRIGSKNKKKAREVRKKNKETHKQEEMSCGIEKKSEGETPSQFGEVEKEQKTCDVQEDCSSESKRKKNKIVIIKLKTGKQVDQDSGLSVKDVQKKKETQCEVNRKSTAEENDFDSKEIKRENAKFVDFGGGLNVTKVARASNFHSRNVTTPEDHGSHLSTDERFHDGQKTAVKRRISVSLGTPNSTKKGRFSPLKSPAQSSFTRRHSWQPYISRCAICKTTDHNTNDPDCPAYDPHPAKRLCFKGPLCCMSNMYPCKLIYQGLTFRSTEHAYQWQRALDIGRAEVARKMLEAVDGFEAKRLSNELDKTRILEWKEKHCIRVMTKLIEAKFEQVEDFRQACIKSTDAYLMEATFDRFWGVGLLEEAASNCKLEYLPGKNILGWIIMQVRNKHVVGLNNHLRDIYQDKDTGRKEMSTFFQGIGHLFGKPFGRDHSVLKNPGRSSGYSPRQSIPPWKRRRSEQSPKTKFTSTLQSFSGQNFRRNYPTPCIFGSESLITKSSFVNQVMDAPGQSDGDAGVILQQHSLGINTIHPSPDIALADVTNFYPLAPSSTWSELMSPRRNDVITPSINQTPAFSFEDRMEDEINEIDGICTKTETGVDDGFELIASRNNLMNTTPFVKRELVKDKGMTRKERKEPTIQVLRLVEYDTGSSDQESDCCEELKSLQESDVEVVTVNDSQNVEPPRHMHAANAESGGTHLSSNVSVGLVKIPKIHKNTGLKTPSHCVDPQFWYQYSYPLLQTGVD